MYLSSLAYNNRHCNFLSVLLTAILTLCQTAQKPRMSWLTAVVVILAVTPITTASHFRGGIIMARHTTGSTNVS